MKKIILSLIIVLTMSGCYVTIQERPYTRSSETFIRHGHENRRPCQYNYHRQYYNSNREYTQSHSRYYINYTQP